MQFVLFSPLPLPISSHGFAVSAGGKTRQVTHFRLPAIEKVRLCRPRPFPRDPPDGRARKLALCGRPFAAVTVVFVAILLPTFCARLSYMSRGRFVFHFPRKILPWNYVKCPPFNSLPFVSSKLPLLLLPLEWYARLRLRW